MKPDVILQIATSINNLPSETQFTSWVHKAIDDLPNTMEMTIRIVDEQESAELNKSWRNKSGATNVLSFPYSDNNLENNQLLGDLVICAPIVENEAIQQNKSIESHWAHLVIHGSLHLLGYDHINNSDAKKMESLEQSIMSSMGYDDPYKTT